MRETVAHVSNSPPWLLRTREASIRRCRSARSAREASVGWFVVLSSGMTNLPSWFSARRGRRGDGDLRLGQPGKLRHVRDHDRIRVFLFEHRLIEGGLQGGQLGVHGLERRFIGSRELGAGPDEILVVTFEQIPGFGVEGELVAPGMESLDTGEKRRVEIDRVRMRGEPGERSRPRSLAGWDWSGRRPGSQKADAPGRAAGRSVRARRWCSRRWGLPRRRRWLRLRAGVQAMP